MFRTFGAVLRTYLTKHNFLFVTLGVPPTCVEPALLYNRRAVRLSEKMTVIYILLTNWEKGKELVPEIIPIAALISFVT